MLVFKMIFFSFFLLHYLRPIIFYYLFAIISLGTALGATREELIVAAGDVFKPDEYLMISLLEKIGIVSLQTDLH